MRISLISEHASPLALIGGVDAGGQNVHVAALASGLARLGATVTVHTRRDDPTLAPRVDFCPGVVVDHVDAGPAEPIPKDGLLAYMGEFADELELRWRQQRPDVVHAHFWMSGLAATDAANRLDIPVALTYHALGIDKRRFQGPADTSPPSRVDIEAWLARAVDHVIATTSGERRTVIGFGADPQRVDVIPCGVDLDLFSSNGSRQQGSGAHVVCLTRLVPRKGLTDVIEAVAGLPGVSLTIAGGPPEAMLTDDPFARQLQALISRLGTDDRIELIGAVDRADVPRLLRSASVVCCTPWYEPFGLVAAEAMGCGVPVVASAVGGLAETVVDGVTGILVPPKEPEAIRHAVLALLRDPARRAVMGSAAARSAARFGWDRIARRTLEVLEHLDQRVANRGGPSPLAIGGEPIGEPTKHYGALFRLRSSRNEIVSSSEATYPRESSEVSAASGTDEGGRR